MKEIIVFDGYCNFCSTWVDFILKRDERKRFLFAASQTEKGIKLLQRLNLKEADSVLLIVGDKVYDRSTAAIYILSGIGGGWRLIKLFLGVPKIIRDPIYTFIAAHRYSWWGQRSDCRIPTREEQERFL